MREEVHCAGAIERGCVYAALTSELADTFLPTFPFTPFYLSYPITFPPDFSHISPTSLKSHFLPASGNVLADSSWLQEWEEGGGMENAHTYSGR